MLKVTDVIDSIDLRNGPTTSVPREDFNEGPATPTSAPILFTYAPQTTKGM